MKLLIILIALMLFNCGDNITVLQPASTTSPIDKTWCSVEKWKSGQPEKIYTLDEGLTIDNKYTEILVYSIDSTKGDSTFIHTDTKAFLIIDEKFSDVDHILALNTFYEIEIKFENEFAKLYSNPVDFVKCIE